MRTRRSGYGYNSLVLGLIAAACTDVARAQSQAASTAASIHRDAMALHQAGRTAAAITRYDEAAKAWSAIAELAEDAAARRQFASAVFAQGVLLERSDRFPEAEARLREAVAAYRRIDGPEGAGVARALPQLGLVLTFIARFDEARQALSEALEIQRGLWPHGAREVAFTLTYLAVVDRLAGGRKVAPGRIAKAEQMARRFPHPDSGEQAALLNQLAAEYRMLGKLRHADRLLRDALEIAPRGTAPEVFALGELGQVNRLEGRFGEAVADLSKAIRLGKVMFGTDSVEVAATEDHLADAYVELGLYSKAEPLLLHYLAVHEAIAKAGNINVVSGYTHLASLYERWNRPVRAEECLREALARSEELLGKNHFNTGQVVEQYAGFLKGQKRQEARAMSERAKAIREGLSFRK